MVVHIRSAPEPVSIGMNAAKLDPNSTEIGPDGARFDRSVINLRRRCGRGGFLRGLKRKIGVALVGGPQGAVLAMPSEGSGHDRDLVVPSEACEWRVSSGERLHGLGASAVGSGPCVAQVDACQSCATRGGITHSGLSNTQHSTSLASIAHFCGEASFVFPLFRCSRVA